MHPCCGESRRVRLFGVKMLLSAVNLASPRGEAVCISRRMRCRLAFAVRLRRRFTPHLIRLTFVRHLPLEGKALRSCGCICAAALHSILQRNSCVPTIDRILYNMYTKIKLQVVEQSARAFAYASSRSYPTPSKFHIPHAEKKGAAPCRSITWPKLKKSLPS